MRLVIKWETDENATVPDLAQSLTLREESRGGGLLLTFHELLHSPHLSNDCMSWAFLRACSAAEAQVRKIFQSSAAFHTSYVNFFDLFLYPLSLISTSWSQGKKKEVGVENILKEMGSKSPKFAKIYKHKEL